MELESKSYSTLRNKKTCGGLPQTKRYPASIHIYAWKQSASETRVLPRVKQVLMRLSLSFSDVRTLTGARLSIQKGFSSQADRRCQGSVAVSVTVSVRMDLD